MTPSAYICVYQAKRAVNIFDPAHPVSIAMEKMKTVPEVRIIEGLDK